RRLNGVNPRHAFCMRIPPMKHPTIRSLALLVIGLGCLALLRAEPPVEVKKPEPKSGKVTDEHRAYWAYKALKRPEPPKVKNTGWVRNPIDAFLLAKLEEKGLTPASP